jgi:CRP-like cAMP-binding protein
VAGLDFRLHFVERAPLFRGLESAACAELVRLARERRVTRKECFFLQGDPAEDVMVLCAGRLKMTQLAVGGEQVILRLMGPGEAFGALDVAAGGTYPVSAEALEASHALVWDRAAIDAFAGRHPVLLRNAVRIVSERLRSLEQRCAELATQKVPQRVAHALLRLVGQIGQPAPDGVLVSLSRDELAQMTGTTLFTVSRLFGEWEARGMVRPRREGAIVTDVQRLASLTEDSRAERRVAQGGGPSVLE